MYYVGLTVIIGSIIWVILYVSPSLIQTVLNSKNKTAPPPFQEAQTSSLPMPPKEYPAAVAEPPAPQTRWVPVQQASVVDEETESEKLRREFRNRSL